MNPQIRDAMRWLAQTEPMNWRLRIYICITMTRHLAAGLIFLLDAERYVHADSFITLFKIASPSAWGVILIAVASVSLFAVVRPSPRRAYFALHLSVFLSTVWAASFLFSRIAIPSASFLLLSIYGALAAKDLTVSGMPYQPSIVVDLKDDLRGTD